MPFVYWPRLLLITPLLALQACVGPLAALGSTGTAAASTAGTSVAGAAVANPVTATSIASTATTGKSPIEHVASAATKKECRFFNLLSAKPLCEEVVIPKVTDYSTPLSPPENQSATSTK